MTAFDNTINNYVAVVNKEIFFYKRPFCIWLRCSVTWITTHTDHYVFDELLLLRPAVFGVSGTPATVLVSWNILMNLIKPQIFCTCP